MVIKFTSGFEHGGFLFGWHKKELYRLPSEIGNRTFGLKKLNRISVGKSWGYRVKREKMSIAVLKTKTGVINRNIKIHDSKDCPF